MRKSNLEDVVTATDVSNSIELCLDPGLQYPQHAGGGWSFVPFHWNSITTVACRCMAASSLSVVCPLLLQSYKKPLHIQSVSNGKSA
ncbi:hypothetical protein ACFX1Q_030311 [Malus domestica]